MHHKQWKSWLKTCDEAGSVAFTNTGTLSSQWNGKYKLNELLVTMMKNEGSQCEMKYSTKKSSTVQKYKMKGRQNNRRQLST
jgi:hypothetical protein